MDPHDRTEDGNPIGANTTTSTSTSQGPTMSYDDLLNVVGRLAGIVEQQVTHNGGNKSANTDQTVATLQQFQKMSPPAFHGTHDPDVADGWIMRMNKIFEVLGCEGNQRVTFATFMLEGEAEHWWRAVKNIIGQEAGPITWETFLKAFNDHFIPDSVREKKSNEFSELIQGNRSVAEYQAKFTQLSRFAPHLVNTEASKARKFIKGLKYQLKEKLIAFQFDTYAAAVGSALNLELLWEESMKEQKNDNAMKRPRPDERYGGDQSQQNKKPNWNNNNNNNNNDRDRRASENCSFCGRSHPGKPCDRKIGACFNCHQKGHFANNCPEARRGNNEQQPNGNNQNRKVTGRIFAITNQEATASPDMV